MNTHDTDAWKSRVLDEVFQAIAESREIVDALVFKGARVLNLRLGSGRQSLDLDSNFRPCFVVTHAERDVQRKFLERELTRAIRRYFERQNPVRLQLDRIKVLPPNDLRKHPLGWDAFEVRMNIKDLSRNVLGLPAITIDIAAPEELLVTSISRLAVGAQEVYAYSLERIAGEKLRAFLSTLPTYREKMKKPGEAVRVKDLYDLARILQTRPLSDEPFWIIASAEFRLASKSRYVDCAGLSTFKEAWDITQKSYAATTIPKDISFDQASEALALIVHFVETAGIIPFSFPLPTDTQDTSRT